MTPKSVRVQSRGLTVESPGMKPDYSDWMTILLSLLVCKKLLQMVKCHLAVLTKIGLKSIVYLFFN